MTGRSKNKFAQTLLFIVVSALVSILPRLAYGQVDFSGVDALMSQDKYSEAANKLINGVPVAKADSENQCYWHYRLALCEYNVSGSRKKGVNHLKWIQHTYSDMLSPQDKERITKIVNGTSLATKDDNHIAVRGRKEIGHGGRSSTKIAWNVKPLGPISYLERIGPTNTLYRQQLFALPFDKEKNLKFLREVVSIPASHIITDEHFVLVSCNPFMSKDELESLRLAANGELNFFQKDFGVTLPKERIILFLTYQGQMEEVAEKIHGVKPGNLDIGYAVPDELSALAVVDSDHKLYGTLFHELSHIVFQNDFAGIPQWLDEGLASVYSVFSVDNQGRLIGDTNQWRHQILQAAGDWHTTPTELVGGSNEEFLAPKSHGGFNRTKLAQAFDEKTAGQATNNAMACYTLLFFQQKGNLPALYRAFRDRNIETVEGDFSEDDVRLLKSVGGKHIDKDFADQLNEWRRDWLKIDGPQ